jgi:radical SAM superfamily enzyme YgiQ (UPF0313 family)
MSKAAKQKQPGLLAAEHNLCPHNHDRSILTTCLIYPNRYQTGMSNLGFQTVYRLLASFPGIVCERAFLPGHAELEEHRRNNIPILSLESRRTLADFDIIAFSTSFEPDYVNIPLMLGLSRIPLLSANRDETHPLVIAGGAALFINPEPISDFMDVICIGEGEEIIPGLVSTLMSPDLMGRRELLTALSTLPGIYVPRFHHPRNESGRLAGFDTEQGIDSEITRVCIALEQHPPSQSVILTENTEFGDMFLVEVSRGCPRGCRFCSSGFIYGPFRQHPFEAIVAAVDQGLAHRNKVGLVGAAVSDYHDIGRLCRYIVERGAKVSVSSLRIDRLDPDMLDALVACGHKTISLAPEGGSQRLRDLIRKNLTEKQILDACDTLISRNILNLKLYFIIGLPTEIETDLEELVRLVMAIRERVLERARANRRLGEITLSINPFIPKPFTPFQWCGMEPLPSLERKVKLLERSFRGIANLHLKVESLKGSYLQALLSRGDRRCSALLAEMAAGASLKKAAKACGIDTDELVYRTIPRDELLPWDLIGTADKELLRKDFERAFGENEKS